MLAAGETRGKPPQGEQHMEGYMPDMLWANKHKVFKYRLEMTDGWQTVEMPAGARVVMVGSHWSNSSSKGFPMIWAEVTEGAPMERRLFRIYGTGHKIDDNDVWVGSFQQPPYVWHVYESNP